MAFQDKVLSMKQGRTLNAASVRASARLNRQGTGGHVRNASLTARSLLDVPGSTTSPYGGGRKHRGDTFVEETQGQFDAADVDVSKSSIWSSITSNSNILAVNSNTGDASSNTIGLSNNTNDSFFQGEDGTEFDQLEKDAAEYEREIFVQALIQETVPVDPSDSIFDMLDRPQCECPPEALKWPCCMRRPVSTTHQPIVQILNACVWVCGAGLCKFWVPVNGHAAWEAALGLHFADSDEERPIDCIPAPAGEDVTEEELAEFWDGMDGNMITLDAVTTNLLISHARRPKCDCGEECMLVICCVSGDTYWVCSQKKCLVVERLHRCADIAAMDVGQFVKMGGSTIDRYTTHFYAMRWFGHTFSKKFFTWLLNRPMDAEFPKGSFQLPEKTEYDAFVSYRGNSGRVPLWISLCGQFNLFPAFCFMFILCPIVAFCMSFAADPCLYYWQSDYLGDGNKLLNFFIWADSCDRVHGQRSWFIFRPLCPILIVFIVIFWHPVFSCFYPNYRFFIDKFC